jgi:hypothetical protein
VGLLVHGIRRSLRLLVMKAFTITSKNIQECPIRSFLPKHYREDGTCRCECKDSPNGKHSFTYDPSAPDSESCKHCGKAHS